MLLVCANKSSLIAKGFTKINLANAPQFLLVIDFIVRQSQATLATFSFPTFTRLVSQTSGNALEVVRHAALGTRRERCTRTGLYLSNTSLSDSTTENIDKKAASAASLTGITRSRTLPKTGGASSAR